MNLSKDKNGFSLVSDNVCFDFITDLIPKESDSMLKLAVIGNVPIPIIKPKDRLLLPVDEGIAITVEKEYPFGAFSRNSLYSEFIPQSRAMSRNFFCRSMISIFIVPSRLQK